MDDLDSFFDDVDRAETNVSIEAAPPKQQQTDDSNNKDPNSQTAAGRRSDSRQNDGDDGPSAAKKRRTEPSSSGRRPHGGVVAAASSFVSASVIPPPPPPPPPPPASVPAQFERPPPPPPAMPDGSHINTISNHNNNNHNNIIHNSDTAPQKKPHVRTAAGKTWTDATLSDWPDDDFRLFVGNLDPLVTDAQLEQHFAVPYASVQRSRVIRDNNKKGESVGYGFVSFSNALECAKALREQDQSWLGGRPIRIKRSHWKDRELKERQKKDKQKNKRR